MHSNCCIFQAFLLVGAAVSKPAPDADATAGVGYPVFGLPGAYTSLHIGGLVPAALPAVVGGYAGAGRYVAYSGGVVHVARREAEEGSEPEPEPESEPGAED